MDLCSSEINTVKEPGKENESHEAKKPRLDSDNFYF